MRRAARIDTTAIDLTTVARQMGALVLPLNGVVDALVYWRGRLFMVDWKTPKGKRQPKLVKTDAQIELEAAGWPICYVGTREQLFALLIQETAHDAR